MASEVALPRDEQTMLAGSDNNLMPGMGTTLLGSEVLQFCDFTDFLRHLDVPLASDASDLAMVAAQRMFSVPLPPHWSEQIDEGSSRVYFFNPITGESLWLHPQEAVFKELIEEVRSWSPDMSLEGVCARSEAHLQHAHSCAVAAIEQWCAYSAPHGPEEAPELGRTAQFYYNGVTGESSWVNPRERVEFELRQRHSILCECVAAHSQNLAKAVASSESSDGEDMSLSSGGAQALVRSLWESLGPLPLPLLARPADLPPANASPGRRTVLSGGEDTVRSSRSFLSARSNLSCAAESSCSVPSRKCRPGHGDGQNSFTTTLGEE